MITPQRNLSVLFLVFCFSSLHASKLVTSNGTSTTSFSFPIHAHVTDGINGLFFVGADQAGTGTDFSLAVASQTKNFMPLAPASILLNGVSASNPLFNKGISHLTLMQNTGLGIVTADEPSTLYFEFGFFVFDTAKKRSFPDPSLAKLLSATTINDAASNVTAGIVGLAAASTGYLFAAVKKNGGNFGEVGGGIALLFAGSGLDRRNAVTGATGGNLAAPLDPTTAAVKITSDLASITANVVDMHYDDYLRRLYIALQVTGGAGASDGARALVVGRLSNGALVFDPIAPDAVFNDATKIVGATGSGAQVSLFKVRTLLTSSRLSYVIVEGGNGTAVGQNIFALPLVDKAPLGSIDDSQHGTLAKFDSNPLDSFFPTYPYVIQSRGLTTVATVPADVLTQASVPARVGGGPLPLGTSQKITDMFAGDDAVYVSIADEYDGTTRAGVFYSQAILDELGRIKAWTPWQRGAGTDEKMSGIGLNRNDGTMWLVPGDSSTTLTVVRLTEWSNGAGDNLLGGIPANPTIGLVGQLGLKLPPEQGGIHNLFTFSETTPGFGNVPATANNQLSLAVATGLSTVVLAETGRNATASIFRANTVDFVTGEKLFTDGALTGFAPDGTAKLVTISGGVLNDIGPLTAAEVSRIPLSGSTANGFLFIGGARGLAVLSRADGTGWSTASPNGGLHAGFVSLTSDMSFKKVGAYTNIRKLWSDGIYLYVLTNTVFDRITISSIVTGPLVVVRLATTLQLGLPDYASFSDFGVSQKLGVLATSGGFFRVANGFNIADGALASNTLGWTSVPLHEGLTSATRLLFLSPTGSEAGFASGGMIYLLGGAVSFNQARVYRFSVKDVSSTSIDDTTLQPLNDLFVKNVPSFFIEFGSYRNFIGTEGSYIFNSVSGNQQQGPLLFILEMLSMGNRYLAKNGNPVIGALPPSPTSSVRQIVRNSASGSWLVGGGHGLFVNE